MHPRIRDIVGVMPHAVGIVHGECPRIVAPIDRLVVLSHDLDVLLRHRLLPQPHGFEGLSTVTKDLLAHYEPVAPSPRFEYTVAQRDAAAPPARLKPEGDHGLVPTVEHFLWLPLELPDLEDSLYDVMPTVMAPMDADEIGRNTGRLVDMN